jgi:hypothetical protein
MSSEFSVRKFTDSASGGVVTVIATTEIPVCDKCWKASKPWWIAFAVCLASAFIGVIPFAIAQDKHVDIPKVFAFVLLGAIAAALGCAFIARRHSPVRLVPNKIDRQNIRIKFLNDAYADAFLQMNKERAQVINPWKYG